MSSFFKEGETIVYNYDKDDIEIFSGENVCYVNPRWSDESIFEVMKQFRNKISKVESK